MFNLNVRQWKLPLSGKCQLMSSKNEYLVADMGKNMRLSLATKVLSLMLKSQG